MSVSLLEMPDCSPVYTQQQYMRVYFFTTNVILDNVSRFYFCQSKEDEVVSLCFNLHFMIIK